MSGRRSIGVSPDTHNTVLVVFGDERRDVSVCKATPVATVLKQFCKQVGLKAEGLRPMVSGREVALTALFVGGERLEIIKPSEAKASSTPSPTATPRLRPRPV